MKIDSWYLDIKEVPELPDNLTQYIESLLPHRAAQWDFQTNEMKEFKKTLLQQLVFIQKNRCVYCGLGLERKSVHREHFAHKGGAGGYEDFVFKLENIFASCEFCNTKLKRMTNVISLYNVDYENCTFSLVHPFFDVPSDSIEFYPSIEKPIVAKARDQKGDKTINLFDLNGDGMWKLRIAYLTQLSLDLDDEVKAILQYQGSR